MRSSTKASSARRPGSVIGTQLGHESLEPRHLLAFSVLVTPQSISVTEGKSVAVTLRLKEAPQSPVVLTLASGNPEAATFSADQVTFSPENWNKPQRVTLRGIEDFLKDGPQTALLSVNPSASEDPTYAALPVIEIAAKVKDSKQTNPFTIKLGQLSTSESDTGAKPQFFIKLNAQPQGNVTIPIHSDTPSEGVTGISSVTFTDANWNVPQPVTVQGIDDQLPDGNTYYRVINGPAVSEDQRFAGRDPVDVRITNRARYSTALYAGFYTGTFGGGASGTIDAVTIQEGTVSVSLNVDVPSLGAAQASGTVSPMGKFSAKAGSPIAGAVFKGTIALSADRSSLIGTGTWKYGPRSGTWQITRPLDN